MHKNLFLGIVFFLLLSFQNANSQSEDQYMVAIVASDTILHGNHFEYKIIIRNMQGDLTPPSFTDFDIVGGPNLSSSMQYNNGAMCREKSYSYFLRARKQGQQFIEEAYLIVDGNSIETEAIAILVMDNPDQIKEIYKVDRKSEYNKIFPNLHADTTVAKKKKKPLKKI